MSELSSQGPVWKAAHSPESTRSPVDQNVNTLDTGVDMSGGEGSARQGYPYRPPLYLDEIGDLGGAPQGQDDSRNTMPMVVDDVDRYVGDVTDTR
jgi:hypothetical protein